MTPGAVSQQIGEFERALDCLEGANLRGMTIVKWAENDSDLTPLHEYPRFVALMRQLKSQESSPE